MMLKRNDGYALTYVLVVLMVLCVIAISVLSAPLRNLQKQYAYIAQMQDRYTAQGMVEQVIAKAERAADTNALDDLVTTDPTLPCQCTGFDSVNGKLYATITATHNNTTVNATIMLEPLSEEDNTGYTVTYHAYDVEVTP